MYVDASDSVCKKHLVRCLVYTAEVFRSHYVPSIVTLCSGSDQNPDWEAAAEGALQEG